MKCISSIYFFWKMIYKDQGFKQWYKHKCLYSFRHRFRNLLKKNRNNEMAPRLLQNAPSKTKSHYSFVWILLVSSAAGNCFARRWSLMVIQLYFYWIPINSSHHICKLDIHGTSSEALCHVSPWRIHFRVM